ncbi:MAG: ABC transporter permease, partial [Ignavibacteriales bacterium]|nr:ABC transporter permease [Ignavibacteriales bacterium]
AGLLALSLTFSLLSPYFFTLSNLVIIVQQSTIIAIIAAGMTFVVISGGIDLSVGSMLAFSGLVMADMVHGGFPLPFVLLAGLFIGYFAGAVNGTLIAYAHLPPFIVTLGTMSVYRGATLMYAGGGSISGFEASFRGIAQGEILNIPYPVVVMILVYVLSHIILTRTKLGRYTYAIGGNEEAAILAGINVRLQKTTLYGICGMLSALSGVLLTARLNSAQAVAGTMYELDAIAATVIGGTSLLGGIGTVVGTLVGALIMGVLRNGLNLLNVSSYVQQLIIGSVIIMAVFVDISVKRKVRLA